MYLIQTVSARPRVWSSHSNIYTKDDVDHIMSSVDNIPRYRDVSSFYCPSTSPRKTAATTYDFPEHPPRKDKKWSLGSLFRRKKKDESDSSSDEECEKKGFLRRRKREKKKKSTKQRATFDHIVAPTGRNILTCNGHSLYDDNGILSDPTGGFASYGGRNSTKKANINNEHAKSITSDLYVRTNLGSSDSLNKKHRKSRAKVRAEARREQNKRDSSSDEDSQRSASSSRFRSDDNLGKPRDSSANRKSRIARTERYIRRISKDEEAPLTREGKLYNYKSDVERLYRPFTTEVEQSNGLHGSSNSSPLLRGSSKQSAINTPLTVSGLFTVPPSHNSQTRNKTESIYNNSAYKPPASFSNSSSKYSSLTNDHKEKEFSYQRSVSYDADIHKSTSPDELPAVLHAQFPLSKPNNRLRNLSLVEQPRIYRNDKHPPPPPPRDPWRLVSVPASDNARPVSYCFERAMQKNNHAPILNDRANYIKPHSFNWHPNCRSASEDQLVSESSSVPVQPRPSSAASDRVVQRFIKRQSHTVSSPDEFRYLTEKNPRSRKPIVIKSQLQSQQQSESQKALNFWKQKDQDEVNRIHLKQQNVKSPPPSPQMFTAQTRVTTKIFLPSVLKADMETTSDHSKRSPSPFKPISPDIIDTCSQNISTDLKPTINEEDSSINNRKSSNLEEALDELEAIYNSLRLGDEDLLERAEQREMSIAAKKLQISKDEPYPGWGIPRGAISDSSFSYEPFDSVDSPKRKRLLKRNRFIDRKCDDMAYRKLNKERKDSCDPKDTISNISYLLTSPVHTNGPEDTNVEIFKSRSKEPDIMFDDVVYRNVKRANSSLKVCEPQPPFGIPNGPILPAANSDYLHAVSETVEQLTPKNKKIPDLVKDDLAFRNLRKDSHKDPVLPPLTADDFTNNNDVPDFVKPDFNSLKKKRAVRSLSANLYNLIQNKTFKLRASDDQLKGTFKNDAEIEKPNLSDIADAMEIARQILKEKENKIIETRRAFLSDTEAKYKKRATNYDNLNERKLNFLNGIRNKEIESDKYQQRLQVNVPKAQDSFLQSKPPSGISPDKKTLIKDSFFMSASTDHVEEPAKASSFNQGRNYQKLLLSPLDQAFDEPASSDLSNYCKSLSSSSPIEQKKSPFEEPAVSTALANSYHAPVSSATEFKSSPFEESVIRTAASTDFENLYYKSPAERVATPFEKHVKTSTSTELSSSYHKSLEDLLTAFAAEADETSKQITKELENSSDAERFIVPKETEDSSESHSNKEFDNLNNSELLAITKTESTPTEEVGHITPTLTIHESLANVVISPVLLNPSPITTEIHSEPEHDYVNMGSDAEIGKDIPMIDESCEENKCMSPFEECKAELIAGFQKLADASISEKNVIPVESREEDGDFEDGIAGEGEACGLNHHALAPVYQECAFLTQASVKVSEKGMIASYVADYKINCADSWLLLNSDLTASNSNMRRHRCDSMDEHLNLGNLASDIEHNSVDGAKGENFGLIRLQSLESPKLVLKSNITLHQNENTSLPQTTDENISHHTNSELTQFAQSLSTIINGSTAESQIPKNIDCNGKQIVKSCENDEVKVNEECIQQTSNEKTDSGNYRGRRHTLDQTQPTRVWYSDPIVLAFACSYGFACTYQLISLDAVAVLGLLFVIVSFVAALIL